MLFRFVIFSLILCLFSCSPDTPEVEKEPEAEVKYYPKHKTLTTQEEVDAFADNGYTNIGGSLMIHGETINNVSALSSINTVQGDLVILATGLENLDGLENINVEEDNLVMVVNNPFITSIRGLRGISGRLSTLEIRLNPELESLQGLEGVTQVTRTLDIINLPKIQNLDGLANVDQPVQYLAIRSTGIKNSQGIANIPEVEMISLTGNPNLISLNMLALIKVGRIFLDRNINLEDINGLSGLMEANELIFQDNTSLKNLDNLSSLKENDDMYITVQGHSALDNFCGIQSLIAEGFRGLNVRDNLYNPTFEQIAGDECRL